MEDPSRHEQNENVGGKDDGRGTDGISTRMSAFPCDIAVPVLGYWVALEDTGERSCDSEAAIED